MLYWRPPRLGTVPGKTGIVIAVMVSNVLFEGTGRRHMMKNDNQLRDEAGYKGFDAVTWFGLLS